MSNRPSYPVRRDEVDGVTLQDRGAIVDEDLDEAAML